MTCKFFWKIVTKLNLKKIINYKLGKDIKYLAYSSNKSIIELDEIEDLIKVIEKL